MSLTILFNRGGGPPPPVTLVVVRWTTPAARSYTAIYDTVREMAPEPRSYTTTVSREREPMITQPDIAPSETRLFKWVFTLAATESATAVVTAVQNCSLSGSHSISISGNKATVTQLVTAGSTQGLVVQVRCRLTTSILAVNQRILDRTQQATIAKTFKLAGYLDVDETDDLTWRMANALAENGSSIVSMAVAVDDGSITLGTPSTTTDTGTHRMSGASGTRVRLRGEFTLANGEVLHEFAYLDVATL